MFSNLLNCGKIDAVFFAVINGQRISGEVKRDVRSPENGSAHLILEAPGLFRDDLEFKSDDGGICCCRQFRNLSGKTLRINELGVALSGITFGGLPRDDFFYHNENPRIYEVMAFPVDYKRTAKDAKDSSFDVQAGNRWADPGVICERIGRSPYQPFPAIVLGNFKKKHGLVHGTLCQKIFYHNYLVSHQGETLLFEIFSGFKDLEYLEAAPDRVLTDRWYLGGTGDAGSIEHVFDNYTKVLRKVLPPMYGATKINRDNMVWGTWNDGMFRDIHEQKLLDEAQYLKKNFPAVRWIQLDDGYSLMPLQGPAHGLGVPYEGDEGIMASKFPHGLRHFTDKIKEIGLRPAIWIGGACPKVSKIFREHPEWFIDYDCRLPNSAPLDVSLPEVRKYMEHALDKLISEYGFESVKHDFWSYPFEDSHDLYRNKTASGYEWRRWWLQELRRRLASDGYLQTGCDIVMGNPFLGEYFTNYRYGIDIGNGNWDHLKTNYMWGMACFATHTGDLFVPNSDSVGLLSKLELKEALFCINYCLVTHSMVEIAGCLSKHQDCERMPILKKAVCNPNNGQDVWFAHWDYLDPAQKYPDVLYFRTAHFCPAEDQAGLPLRTVGLFNLEEQEKELYFTAAQIGLEKGHWLLTDVWTGETMKFGDTFRCTLPAHGSRLLAVSADDPVQLLDADIRILRSEKHNNTMELVFDYAKKATLTFRSVPAKILLDGREIPSRGRELHVEIGKNSVMELLF